jgi:predicted nucleotidyltransferase
MKIYSIAEQIINSDEEPIKKKNVGVKRQSVEPLLNDLIQQAKFINTKNDKYTFPYTVRKLWVYGSYLNSDKPKLGDIDIFYEFQCRWKDDDRQEMYKYFNKMRTSPHRDIFDWMTYPERLILMYLRNKHRSFSFHDIRDLPNFKPSEKQMIYKEIYNF